MAKPPVDDLTGMVGAGEATALAGCVCAAAPSPDSSARRLVRTPLPQVAKRSPARVLARARCCGQRVRGVFQSKEGQWGCE